jgi:hypothetical protein
VPLSTGRQGCSDVLSGGVQRQNWRLQRLLRRHLFSLAVR